MVNQMSNEIKKIGVVGLGLLGGSLCRAIKKFNSTIEVVSFGRSLKSMERALQDGNVDSIELLDNLSGQDIDLFIVAMPVEISKMVIKRIINLDDLKESALVIDVGSVKKEIVDYILTEKNAGCFIGCHPMAGSEKTGYLHSSFDLYKDATVVITPVEKNKTNDVKKLELFWKSVGANVVYSSPEEHDLIVAYISHMPHIVASSVVNGLKNGVNKNVPYDSLRSLIGGGFRDVTRVASGSPDMWRDIVVQNRKKITESVKDVIFDLTGFLNIIDDSDMLYDYFSNAKKFRDNVMKKRIIVAIDGPAGSGKSSVSKEVAVKMGLKYIDSGAIYRSITWYLLKEHGKIVKIEDAYHEFSNIKIIQKFQENGETFTFLNEEDISLLIREEKITSNIGKVSEQESIRTYVTDLLRKWSEVDSVIMDGRDIGTDVFQREDLNVKYESSVD